jgi:hypothetical protein
LEAIELISEKLPKFLSDAMGAGDYFGIALTIVKLKMPVF